MNLKTKIILDEYRQKKSDFQLLQTAVKNVMGELVAASGVEIFSLGSRIKAEDSLRGKLERKGDKYSSLADITDILGTRIVTTYSDGVDAIAKLIPEYFIVDVENSVDKRTLLKDDVFGYMSVHFICSLRPSDKYPEEICAYRFEIQICSVLQHVWSLINHDLGYKTEFGVPHSVRREFARLASLVEIADEHFIKVRDTANEYTSSVHEKIISGNVDGVSLDYTTLKEYMQHSAPMTAYQKKLSESLGVEIEYVAPDSYMIPLLWLGKNTIGDVQKMLEENGDRAIDLARTFLENTDLDIISSTVALRFLCQTELLVQKKSREEMVEFFTLLTENNTRAQRMADSLLKKADCILR